MARSETQIVLIRHGESSAQTQGRLVGHDSCTGLSEGGNRQAVALRERLLQTGELDHVGAVYTSIQARSIETAVVLQPALGGLNPGAECDWCEIHAGQAEGLRFEQLRERFPPDADEPFTRRIPGAETWAEFYVRVGTRLLRVVQEHPGQTVVVVGHGGTVGASFVALGDLPVRRATALTRETLNGSMTRWRLRDGEWRLLGYNDIAHLLHL